MLSFIARSLAPRLAPAARNVSFWCTCAGTCSRLNVACVRALPRTCDLEIAGPVASSASSAFEHQRPAVGAHAAEVLDGHLGIEGALRVHRRGDALESDRARFVQRHGDFTIG